MAVRGFDGIDDNIHLDLGALSAMAYGTIAIIFKRGVTGSAHTLFSVDNSAGNGELGTFFIASDNLLSLWNGSASATGPTINNTTDWFLVVWRKATGTTVPRSSIYNFTSQVWSHAAWSGSVGDWTAGGVGGTAKFSYVGSQFYQGNVAVRAAWSNSLPWSADTAGDTVIEATGLETSAANWLNAAPGAMWRFNQAAVTTTVEDDTGGGANETARTGTTVVTGDDPPGFDFNPGGPPPDLEEGPLRIIRRSNLRLG